MGQRLGIAAALLADPQTLILDEPVNGLDPEGVRWIRNLLKGLADQGRTVLLSSHLMSEMALTADHVIILGRGRVLRDQPVSEFVAGSAADVIRVRVPHAAQLATLLTTHAGATVRTVTQGVLDIERLTSDEVGRVAGHAQLTLLELSTQTASLEQAYMALTEDTVSYRSHTPTHHTDPDPASTDNTPIDDIPTGHVQGSINAETEAAA